MQLKIPVRLINAFVGFAVALSLLCLGAWVVLVVALFEHTTGHPFFLEGLGFGNQRDVSTMIVVVLFWVMPLWIALFAGRLKTHWRAGRTGLLPALLMNASAVPVLAAMSVLLLVSDG
jgi:hypothetical protein